MGGGRLREVVAKGGSTVYRYIYVSRFMETVLKLNQVFFLFTFDICLCFFFFRFRYNSNL